jgi:uncharacterized protein YjbJ (UPF0337 family)
MHELISSGRWKQWRGRVHKMWGKLTHNPYVQFLGELDMVEGKIEEYQARQHGPRLRSASGRNLYTTRRRGDLVA